jgi:hypothetical protein
MIRSIQWKKINYLSAAHSPCSVLRMRCGRIHDGGAAAFMKARFVAIEQRTTSAVGRPLCTTDRCSDIFKDPLQPPTFNLKQRTLELKQRTLEEAG